MRFKDYYLKELFSNWHYKPEDFYSAMYDFYALSVINPDSLRDEDLAYALKDAQKTIIDYWYKELLYNLKLAISAEIAHYLHFRKPSALEGEPPKWLKGGDRVKKFFLDYVKYFADPDKRTSSDKLILEPHKVSYAQGYKDVYEMTKEFMKKYGYRPFDLFEFAKFAFADGSGWISDQYGGSAWKNIAESAIQALDVPNVNQRKQFEYLDYVFDLEHNTGSIFTKNKELDSFRIKKILDDKRYISNPMSFYFDNPYKGLTRISQDLRGPWAAYVKDVYGKTAESERAKVEIEDMLRAVTKSPLGIKNIKDPPREVQQAAVKADPYAVTYIEDPDIDIMRMAIDKDPDVFKSLKSKDKNRLPADYVKDMFGFHEDEPEKEPVKTGQKKGLADFLEI